MSRYLQNHENKSKQLIVWHGKQYDVENNGKTIGRQDMLGVDLSNLL